MPNNRVTTAASVLRSIADDKSMAIFRRVAQRSVGSKRLKADTRLTRKQYYIRLSRLTKCGLVKKKNGKYALTAFGKVVYESQAIVDIALLNLQELEAVDSLDMPNELSKEQRQQIIDTLIGKDKLGNFRLEK